MSFKDKLTHFLNKPQPQTSEFVMGVANCFSPEGAENATVIGTVKGTLRVGDTVYISNFYDDKDSDVSTATVTEINNMKGDNPLKVVVNNSATIKISGASSVILRSGTVFHSKDVPYKEIWSEHLRALGDNYIFIRNLELSDGQLHKMTITDCVEIWSIYTLINNTNSPKNNYKKAEIANKVNMLANAIVNKLFELQSIYCMYSRATGEPALFSRTYENNGTYSCSKPYIWVFIKPYRAMMESTFGTDEYEIKEIKNNQEKNAIKHFFEDCVFLNGACGVNIIHDETGINAEMLVKEPDYSNIPDEKKAITNPNVERWLLLLGQLGTPETQDAHTLYNLYFSFLAKELANAKLLIPMKNDGDNNAANNESSKEGSGFPLATIKGKGQKDAILMYTDWKHLKMGMGDENWDVMIQTINGAINNFDCAINLTKYAQAGFYVNQEMFDSIKKISGI